MLRCAFIALVLSATALPALSQAVQRPFPADALRGEISFGQPPAVEVNGTPARLAPGARIRGENNLLLMSGAVAGQTLVVHYTRDNYDLVKDVWVLTPAERQRKPRPTTPAEAAAWQFNAFEQAWRKP